MTGLLSLAETDESDKAEWGWYEKRDPNLRVDLDRIGAEGPFSAEGSDVAFGAAQALANGTVYRLRTVADGTNKLHNNHTVWVMNIPLDGGGVGELFGHVTNIVSTDRFEFRLLSSGITINNSAAAWPAELDIGANIVGTANPEGSLSGSGIYNLPELSTNYMQIFKKGFSSTGTSLQEGMEWSDTGHYADKSWEAMRNHAKEMEHAAMFGFQTKTMVDNGEGELTPMRTMKGVYQYLRSWDTATGATDDDDPNKRIINNSSGVMSYKQHNRLMERLFEQTNDRAFIKVCFAGSGHLSILNEVWEDKVTVNTRMIGDEKMQFRVWEVTTPAGTVIYHTHPLFTQNPDFKYAGLYVDINNLHMVPLNGRDTMLHENIQPNDADYRKDQYLTEIGLECQFPDSHMFIHNVRRAA